MGSTSGSSDPRKARGEPSGESEGATTTCKPSLNSGWLSPTSSTALPTTGSCRRDRESLDDTT
ncbi:hypothetical protein E2C01_089460 [Portunus trituberculatus]|uniref:Uncharacterized protein n=1 Tax=Portunus trituberculatus TaxID=210409 RepID=A0A5B7JJ35_PORTR|nr:hypothetical protein [Portunus trituberculatus]